LATEISRAKFADPDALMFWLLDVTGVSLFPLGSVTVAWIDTL
jgi:hypothetical protein